MGRTLKQSSTKIASCFFWCIIVFVWTEPILWRNNLVGCKWFDLVVFISLCPFMSMKLLLNYFLWSFFPPFFFLHVFFSLQNKRWHSMMDIDLINVTLELSCLKIIYIKTFISVFHFLFGGLRWRMLTLVSKRKN